MSNTVSVCNIINADSTDEANMKEKVEIKIPFNKPTLSGNEIKYILAAIENCTISGDGSFTKKCHKFIEETFIINKVLLTTSCTHALEMAFLLINIQPDDEVIVPSFTFTSTINAFLMRGAKPVFVDIRPDTLNIDEKQIISKITSNTKAICPVHYAGVGCEMDVIMDIAEKYNLYVIEDAAQGIDAKYKDKYLGTFGHLSAISFHESKNISCGEGGALLINDPHFIKRAEIIREKGTNRSQYHRGEVEKYSWIDVGSSYLPADILAAYLYAQLENLKEIRIARKKIFEYYRDNLKDLECKRLIKTPHIPSKCVSNYHMFYILLDSQEKRDKLMYELNEKGINAVFHYLPLHSSPMGRSFGYKAEDLPNTEDLSGRLLRLPFYNTLTVSEQDYMIDNIKRIILGK